jgi:tetratricopeptide (TPR) repeat protein
MALHEFLAAFYEWADARAYLLLLVAVAVPPLGALLARGLRTRFPEEARLWANALVAFGLLSVLLAVGLLVISLRLLDRELLAFNVLLLVAPVLGLAGTLASVRLVFELRELWMTRELASLVGFGVPEAPEAQATVPRPRRVWPAFAVWAVLATTALVLGSASMESPELESSGEPISLSVADVANETGDKEFDSLSGLLITALEQSQRLEVMSRPAMFDVLKQLGRADVTRIDEALALEVCQHSQVRALVLTALRKFDDLYTVDLKVLDPQTRKYLFTAKEEGQGRAAIPRMIDRLSERLRKGLRERQSEIAANQRSVESLATPVMEAYQAFFEAEQHFSQRRVAEAVAGYRKAIALDAHFAPARLRLSYLVEFYPKPGLDSRQEIQRAMADLERAPLREQLLIRAWHAHLTGKDEEATALFARAAAEFPTDKMTLYLAGDFQFHRERYALSVPYLEKVLALDPSFDYAAAHLAQAFTEMGDEARADALWKQALALRPDFKLQLSYAAALGRWQRMAEARQVLEKARTLQGQAHSCVPQLVSLLLNMEDVKGAESILAQCDEAVASGGGPPEEVEYIPVVLALYRGQFGKVIELSRALLAQARHPLQQENLRSFIVLALARKGQGRAAVEELMRAAEVATAESTPKFIYILVQLGELDRARALHAAHPTPDGALRLKVEEAARRGDWEAAFSGVRELARLHEKELRRAKEIKLSTMVLLAELQLRAKRPAEALRTLEEARRVWLFNFFTHAALHGSIMTLEAQSHEQLGNRERARALSQQLVELWKDADKDAVDLMEARRRLGAR